MSAEAPEGGWKVNVGGFIKAHPAWSLRADGAGYIAQAKKDGRPRGPVLRALSLDELGEKIARAETGRAAEGSQR